MRDISNIRCHVPCISVSRCSDGESSSVRPEPTCASAIAIAAPRTSRGAARPGLGGTRRRYRTAFRRFSAPKNRWYARSMSAASLSVIVPAYNEESRLPTLLDRLERDMDGVLAGTSMRLAEVIVVDDGSSDATATVVDAHDSL